MNYIMIILTILVFSIQTLCWKEFNLKYMKNTTGYMLFNFIYFLVAFAVVFACTGLNTRFSAYSIVCGLLFGILFVTATYLYMKAMETGPLSYSSLAFTSALVIPVMFSMIFLKEPFKLVQLFGLILIFVTFYLGTVQSNDKSVTSFKKGWIFYSLTSFMVNGAVMLTTKIHQAKLPGQEIGEFLMVSFGICSILSLAIFLLLRINKNQQITSFKGANFIYILLGAGISTAFGNILSVSLTSKVPAIVQFPAVNGGLIIMTSILSILVYKESLSSRGKLGLGLGLGALILLSI